MVKVFISNCYQWSHFIFKCHQKLADTLASSRLGKVLRPFSIGFLQQAVQFHCSASINSGLFHV